MKTITHTSFLKNLKRFSFICLCFLFAITKANAQANSIHFDGANDYVNCGNDASLNITGTALTLEAWIYPTSFKTNVWEGNVINKNGAGDNGYMLRVGNSGQVNFNIGTGSWNEINSATGAVALNTWSHIAGTYDGTTMRLYVNGTQVATGGLSANIGSASNPLYIGEDPQWGGRYFPGRIDEVRVWNVTRTAAEINANMNNELCGGPVAYYQFNQGTAGGTNTGLTNVIDFTGVNNGTLINSSLSGTTSNWVVGQTLTAAAGAMSYVSSTVTQPNTTFVSQGQTDAEIIAIEVVTTGCSSPIDLTQLRIQTTGSSDPLNDISNITVYYTGASNTFSTATTFGTAATAAVSTNIQVNGTQTLSTGSNYFWVAFDIAAGATLSNVVDALCNRITVDGTNQFPSPTTPAGSRPILNVPDNACNAQAITVNTSCTTVTYDNTGLTDSGFGNPSCASYGGGPDMWFTVTVPLSGEVTVETSTGSTSLSDMDIEIFSGTNCSSLTSEGCTDGGSNIAGSNTFDAGLTVTGQTPGNTLWIRVWQYGGGQGTFDLCAWDPNPSTPNDDPCTASTLAVGCAGTLFDQPNFATWTNSSITAPSCGNYGGRDAWFETTVPSSGDLKVEAFAGSLNDCAMSFYTSSGSCSGTLTEIACDANSGNGNMPRITITGYTPGQTIYIRVWDENDDETGTFSIEATDPDAVFCLNGNGADIGGGCARLTANTNNQQSSIWDANDVLNFGSDFSYDFEVMLGNDDGGADGIAFVIQNDPDGRQATGVTGGALGAGGIINSLIFEIDTYLNTEDRDDGMPTVLCSGGPNPDHLDIWENGNINPSGICGSSPGARIIPNAVELQNGGSAYNIENGLRHTFRISYVSATQTITATVLDLTGATTYGTVSYSPVDTTALFGTGTPYFGFTGSTGGLFNEQYACLDSNLWLLPVNFIDVNVTCINKGNQIEWITTELQNDDFFVIQKSFDGKQFIDYKTISASEVRTQYEWLDDDQRTAYYRIKLEQENKKSVYSITKKSACYLDDFRVNYTTQNSGQLIVNSASPIEQDAVIKLIDVNGRLVSSTPMVLNEGINTSVININGLGAGMYYTLLETRAESKGIKTIIK